MIELGSSWLSLEQIKKIVFENETVDLSLNTFQMISNNYEKLISLSNSSKKVYGLNTGFGALAEKRISSNQMEKLQKNLIVSHAVGVGEALDFSSAKILMLLRLCTLAKGYSGASPSLIKTLLALINADVAPYVPRKGSVGASGDLAPLAHLGLLLLGLGKAYHKGEPCSAKQALQVAKISPLKLGLRDGLALINGTQAMCASGIISIIEVNELVKLADLNLTISLLALKGHLSPFDQRLHELKAFSGQIKSARNLRRILKGQNLRSMENQLTQDPYSLRCASQVHGASIDVLSHVKKILMQEANSVTDNPVFFTDAQGEVEVISGGNFHGQGIALGMDYLCMATSELANISERRMELLLNKNFSQGLPAFLSNDSGISSGYMMLQVTAASLVNENKVLCHPASTDSIPTSANREDHVSMGMTSANKLRIVVENTKDVLAIESLMAHQAIDLGSRSTLLDPLKRFHEIFREEVPFRAEDHLYGEDLQSAKRLMQKASWRNLLTKYF